MTVPEPGRTPGRLVSRRELELVVRRAAELTAAELETEEGIPEEEVVRIAAELGLPATQVRRAIYELPETPAAGGRLDRSLGEPLLIAGRGVPGQAEPVLRGIEEYLATEQYLKVRRRREGYASFSPADDFVSKVSRAFRSGDHELNRADAVAVTVRALDPERVHVRVDVDLASRRRSTVGEGVAAGSALGVLGMGIAAAVAFPIAAATVGPDAFPLAAAGSALAGVGTGIVTGARFARSRFQRYVGELRTEVEGLLDRLERRESLKPPPAPWRRKLEQGLEDLKQGRW